MKTKTTNLKPMIQKTDKQKTVIMIMIITTLTNIFLLLFCGFAIASIPATIRMMEIIMIMEKNIMVVMITMTKTISIHESKGDNSNNDNMITKNHECYCYY